MHQPIDIELDTPEPTAAPTAEAARPERPTPRPVSDFDLIIAQLNRWVAEQEAARAAMSQALVESPPPVESEPHEDIIEIPDDVPCFETV